MRLDVPDDIVQLAEVNAGDLLLAMAIQLYADNRIDHSDACRLARMPRGQFNSELAGRGISIHMYPRIGTSRRKVG